MKPQRNRKPKPKEVPFYDSELRELWFRGQLVKRYRQGAVDQILILQAFQELGWPAAMDDPLRKLAGRDPKEHLRQTITNLKRRLKLITFVGLGTGDRIGWKLRS